MANSNDVQALENISTEVDNFQLKILISSQCIKAQAFLFNKLTKQSERQKEICRFIGSSNLKLETEITISQQEIKSLKLATETIKLGNIELNKEYLLSKERKVDIFERIKLGKKKYENLWLVSEKKYQSIPIVQKLIEAKNNYEIIQSNIDAFTAEYKHLVNQIKIKKNNLEHTDKQLIVELAHFLVQERPQMFSKINENKFKIKEVLNELENDIGKEKSYKPHVQPLPKDQQQIVDTIKYSSLDDNWPNLNKLEEKDDLMLPKLPLQNNELDILSVKLDQLKKVDLQNTTSMKRTGSLISTGVEENSPKMCKREEIPNENFISPYFDISLSINNGNDEKQANNYSGKKLIHILEDIKLDKNDTLKIINNIKPIQLQETNNIRSYEKVSNSQSKENKSFEIEEIVDSTKSIETDVVNPPMQFLDSQPSEEKKTASLVMSTEKETPTLPDQGVNTEQLNAISQERNALNNSTASEDNYTKIKDMLLKKHNLDLSPVFVYAKNTLMQKQQEDEVKSKFFESKAKDQQNVIKNKDEYNENKYDQTLESDKNKPNESTCENVICTSINYKNTSSPKEQIRDIELPVSGFLFNHGAEGIPNSLNVSINTTGFEDNEDFPHCIDSSLLLSPKANIPITMECSNNNEVLSQEVPNFLTGFRKTGISFFGGSTSSDNNPESGGLSQTGGFSFTFANDEKKGRGGLFSMFH